MLYIIFSLSHQLPTCSNDVNSFAQPNLYIYKKRDADITHQLAAPTPLLGLLSASQADAHHHALR